MAKLTTTNIGNISGNPTTAESNINTNNAAIAAALENTLSRDGTAPNTMSADLDMNSQRVTNLSDASNPQDAVTKSQLEAYAAYALTGAVGASIVTYAQQGASSVEQSLEVKLQKVVHVSDFGVSGEWVTNLSSCDGNIDGSLIYLTGYYADGDGGGGVFYWDASSMASDDGGTIIKATSVTTGRWLRLYDGPVSVLWFGAYRGRINLTETTAAIQAAFDGFARTAGVRFPEGQYEINATLTITGGNWWINGDSKEHTFLYASSAVTGAIIDINNGGTDVERGYIGNMRILGATSGSVSSYATSQSVTFYANYGLRINKVDNGLVCENLDIRYTKVVGLFLVERCWFATLKNCWMQGHQGDGWKIGAACNGVSIENCYVYLSKRGATVQSSLSVAITGGGIEDIGGSGLIIAYSAGFTINGTFFEDVDFDNTDTVAAIDIRGAAGDTDRPSTGVISGCQLNSSGETAIKAVNAKLTIKGNTFLGTTVYGVEADSDSYIDATIYDNHFASTLTEAFNINVKDLVSVDGNWTPVISDAASGGNTGTFTNVTANQRYHKNGRMVTVSALLTDVVTTSMTGTSTLYVQGLPIPIAANGIATGSVAFTNTTLDNGHVNSAGDAGASAIRFTEARTGNTLAAIKVQDLTSGTADIYITFTYPVDY